MDKIHGEKKLSPQIDESEYKMPESNFGSGKSKMTFLWTMVPIVIFLVLLVVGLSFYIYMGMKNTPADMVIDESELVPEVTVDENGETLEEKAIRLEAMMINDNSNPTDEQISRLNSLSSDSSTEPTAEQIQRLEQMNPGTFKEIKEN